MKITIFAFCFLCATAAFGQTASVLVNNPQPIEMLSHDQHASQHAMRQEESLLGCTSPYTYAQGEQPVWEFGTPKQEVPLGDVARAYRQGHVIDRKAAKVVENN
jgi:hypothetical protein